MELGCTEAEVWLLEGDPAALTLQRRVGIDPNPSDTPPAAELFARVRAAGVTQIEVMGRERMVVCLLHREGEPAGLFRAQMSESDAEDTLLVECIELLATQVSAGLDVARNVAERRGLEERLAHWAFHDSLTDLPNRVLFADRLELALARTARDGTKVAVLFLDLDNFKEINDSLGHTAGDELLQAVAHRLHGCLRPNDTLARYGGDEFVVLVEQIDNSEAAVLVANRILETLSTAVIVAGTELMVRTSIGIALTGARPGADSDVLRRADIAMYQAKGAGGNRFVMSPAPESDAPKLRPAGEAS
nr:GGDEF domain protein [uncultured bacterium]